MNTFSRWLPPAVDAPWTTKQKASLAVLVFASVAAMVRWESVRFAGIVTFVVLVLRWLYEDRRTRALAATRQGEDIGTFARAFDRRARQFDPWVIRAVWDALRPYRTYRGGAAPLRPSDRLDSFVDRDDLDYMVWPDVATRAGRVLDNPEANPKFGHVDTVADLVEFVYNQPRDLNGRQDRRRTS